MLFLGLLFLLIAVPLFSSTITPNLCNRITAVTLIFAACLSLNALYVETIMNGISIYNGLFHVTNVSLGIEIFLLLVGATILFGWASSTSAILENTTATPSIREHSLLILFTTLGACLLVASSDLISIFLAIELQSFAVYVLATLYRDSESSTAAGLKYFLLGGLSSALILLGTAVIYSNTGLTHFESIYSLLSVPSQEDYLLPFLFGLFLIGVGLLFKVAAAPFHNWAPDVYDGTPTIITAWLSTIPKISIFLLFLELQTGMEGNSESLTIFLGNTSEGFAIWKNLLLSASLLSLLLGTILGLSQYRMKRLLTYSTISHVGFLLLALAMNTEESVESFLFYILQYSLTNVTIFLVLLAFGYTINNSPNDRGNHYDILFIQELKGQFLRNPLLSFSFALCLFSIAGIPPLIGFFAKQMVLYSSMHSGYYFLSIVAILVSVISASYYLRIVQVMYFSDPEYSDDRQRAGIQTLGEYPVTTIHSTLIAILTAVIVLFMFHPTILLNSCQLLALSIYY